MSRALTSPAISARFSFLTARIEAAGSAAPTSVLQLNDSSHLIRVHRFCAFPVRYPFDAGRPGKPGGLL